MMKSVSMLVAVAATLGAAVPAAATFTLGNSQGGDGFVIEIAPGRFDLFGANDETEGNLTRYTTTALTAGTISGQFRYLTLDIDGSNFDPAGYFINNVFVALSDPDLLAYSQNFGTFSFNVAQGDSYGFYVAPEFSFFGRGVLTIGAIPEPSSWAMLIAGFGLVGTTLRRRRVAAA